MKRILVAILSLLSLSIYAQEELPVILSGQITSPIHHIDSRDYRFDGYASHAMPRTPQLSLTQPKDSATRWIDRIYNMPDYLTDFYNSYVNAVNQVLGGSTNYLSDPTLAQYGSTDNGFPMYYVPLKEWKFAFKFGYDPKWTQDDLGEIVLQLIYDTADPLRDTLDYFMPYLTMCMDYDIPQAFWVTNGISWSTSLSYTLKGSGTTLFLDITFNSKVVLKTIGTTDDFDIRIENYPTKEAVSAGVIQYREYVSDILKDVPDGSTYDKVRYLNNWLTRHNCYGTSLGQSKEPDIIRSSISALKGSAGYYGPVCEGYARAFKVLADTLGIPCILVIGDACSTPNSAREGHMWNEIRMDDGKWYGVDVTWNDPVVAGADSIAQSGFETETWLLVGKNTSIRGQAFKTSHPNQVNNRSGLKTYLNHLDCHLDTYLDSNSFLYNTNVEPTFIDQPTKYNVYAITGVYLGEFDNLDMLEPGMYIINNRKVSR